MESTTLTVGKSEIVKLLKLDRECRKEGITGDVFDITDIHRGDWDCSLPTLQRYTRDTWSRLPESHAEFTKKYRAKYSLIPTNKRFFKNVLIAGGSVSETLTTDKTNRSINDIDIFLYGLTPEEASSKVVEIVEDMINELVYQMQKNVDDDITKRSNRKEPFTADDVEQIFSRSNNCITILLDKYKVQIILRIYSSPSEILHGFDLGSSAVGFDDDRMYFTSLSKFAYEYNANILDTTRRSTTYERRLTKYLERGFNIILPNLDVSQLSTTCIKYNMKDVCELPFIAFSYSDIRGNMIHFDKLLSKYAEVSDYNPDDVEDSEMPYKISHFNHLQLIRGKANFYYYGEKLSHVVKEMPYIRRDSIVHFYHKIRKELEESTIHLNRIRASFGDDRAEKVIALAVEKNRNDAEISSLVAEQEAIVLARFEALKIADNSIKWMTENVGTQLTSSFNPIIEDVSVWYGKYYLA